MYLLAARSPPCWCPAPSRRSPVLANSAGGGSSGPQRAWALSLVFERSKRRAEECEEESSSATNLLNDLAPVTPSSLNPHCPFQSDSHKSLGGPGGLKGKEGATASSHVLPQG